MQESTLVGYCFLYFSRKEDEDVPMLATPCFLDGFLAGKAGLEERVNVVGTGAVEEVKKNVSMHPVSMEQNCTLTAKP